VNVDIRAKLDFLDFDDLLLLARFGLLFLFLETVLAVIEDLADRRIGGRRDFDQVETGFLGGFQCG